MALSAGKDGREARAVLLWSKNIEGRQRGSKTHSPAGAHVLAAAGICAELQTQMEQMCTYARSNNQCRRRLLGASLSQIPMHRTPPHGAPRWPDSVRPANVTSTSRTQLSHNTSNAHHVLHHDSCHTDARLPGILVELCDRVSFVCFNVCVLHCRMLRCLHAMTAHCSSEATPARNKQGSIALCVSSSSRRGFPPAVEGVWRTNNAIIS